MVLQSGLMMHLQALTETGNKDLALDSLKAFDSGS